MKQWLINWLLPDVQTALDNAAAACLQSKQESRRLYNTLNDQDRKLMGVLDELRCRKAADAEVAERIKQLHERFNGEVSFLKDEVFIDSVVARIRSKQI